MERLVALMVLLNYPISSCFSCCGVWVLFNQFCIYNHSVLPVVQSDGSRTVSSSSWTGRQKTRTSVVQRPSTAVRLPPLAGCSCTTFSFLFHFHFSFLFPFSALVYLSTSICLIDYFCVSVVDGRRRPSTPSRTASRQSIASNDETASSIVVLTPSWTDERLRALQSLDKSW